MAKIEVCQTDLSNHRVGLKEEAGIVGEVLWQSIEWTSRTVEEDFSTVTSPNEHANTISMARIFLISKSRDPVRGIARERVMAAPHVIPTLGLLCRVLNSFSVARLFEIRLPYKRRPNPPLWSYRQASFFFE